MDGRVRLDQAFYGYGRSGYGLAGYSFDDEGAAWAAINVCLAIGQATGSRLPKPILLSRILGDKIVMARICNGAKDPSGRNTLFVHALVGLSQEVSKAHVTAFTLEEAGIFRDSMPGHVVEAIMVAANPAPATTAHASVELPAAIETSGPDEDLVRRIVAGRENELSWSTFAFEDMPGYDVICISPLAASPAGRSIYDEKLSLVRSAIIRKAASSPAPTSIRNGPPRPREGSSPASCMASNGKRGLLVPLVASICVNAALLAALFYGRDRCCVNTRTSATSADMPQFKEKNRVTDEELKPLKDFMEQRAKMQGWEDKCHAFNKLLGYRDFVEKELTNQTKEK